MVSEQCVHHSGSQMYTVTFQITNILIVTLLYPCYIIVQHFEENDA